MTPITGAKNEYHSGNIHLYQMDCNDLMAQLPDKYADLSCVDPPYGIKESAHRNISRTKLAKTKNYKKEIWDMRIPDKIYFNELFRISKDQIIWGINYFTNEYQFSSGRIVWDKDNGENNFSDCELAYQSYTHSTRLFRYKWQGMLQENMKDKETRIHPTQKPIQLYKWLLKNYAKPEFKIIDTHLGSMSSVIAAYDFGVSEFIGAELDPDYFAAGVKRFKTHQLQQTFNFEK
jgi:site-specific DNA-methyltransferase (adenine-specific)